MMMKRLFCGLMAALLLMFSVIMPARAFVPVAVIGPPVFHSISGSTYFLGAVSGIIGLTGMWLTVQDAINGDSVRIPLSDKPESQPPVPTAQPSLGTITLYDGASSVEAACQQYAASNSTGVLPGVCSGAPGSVVFTYTGLSGSAPWQQCQFTHRRYSHSFQTMIRPDTT